MPNLTQRITVQRVTETGTESRVVPEVCEVAVEAPITLEVAGGVTHTILCTPSDTKALVIGFLFAEGGIESIEAIESIEPDSEDSNRYCVHLKAGGTVLKGRGRLVTTSSGLSGQLLLEETLAGLSPVGDAFRISHSALRAVEERLCVRQKLFPRTGGTHAAGLVTEEGEMLYFAEDVGRHNALDKAIGMCLLEKRSPAGLGVMLSGRVSLEMSLKCARAGLELIGAVSAPTALALEVARRCNITLCGFVRGERATLFCHPHRVAGNRAMRETNPVE